MPTSAVSPPSVSPVSPSTTPREQTDLDITITAASDVNPDDKGRASPIQVRLYELRSTDAFDSADYFSLQHQDRQILASVLLARDDFILRPGEVKTIRRKSHPDVAAIAVVAGYRDLAHADWRAVQAVALGAEPAWYRFAVPSPKATLLVQLQATGVHIAPQ